MSGSSYFFFFNNVVLNFLCLKNNIRNSNFYGNKMSWSIFFFHFIYHWFCSMITAPSVAGLNIKIIFRIIFWIIFVIIYMRPIFLIIRLFFEKPVMSKECIMHTHPRGKISISHPKFIFQKKCNTFGQYFQGQFQEKMPACCLECFRKPDQFSHLDPKFSCPCIWNSVFYAVGWPRYFLRFQQRLMLNHPSDWIGQRTPPKYYKYN